ncbi:hypothetical protein FPCIR_11797 [Fusarium pseudocircinatum]|uniref:Mid2 domain-containing protein n=1 Tax=Fusarium pseudocircinatum TaxID=56676 RepID=A0A8H5KT32_9HYPO|nr:hypothetical protein FPCIR_11797 [Fusarium pseudocircinatum]
MTTISTLTIVLSIFASRVLCNTKFLRPPEWNAAVDRKAGLGENVRYAVGDTIQLLWETDLDSLYLFLYQRAGSLEWYTMLNSSDTEWKAVWDIAGALEGNEDAMYYFTLFDNPEGTVASTQYFNVTAPELETTIATTLQTSTTIQSMSSSHVETSATQPLPTSTVTNQSSDSVADPDSDSGMSKGEIAGAAVGGTIGGLILLGVVGWFIWRRLGRSKKVTDVSVGSQSHQQQFQSSETKAELPGDPALEVYPAGYARSPPGLHEAP